MNSSEKKSKRIPKGFFQIGLLISAGLTLVAFEYQSGEMKILGDTHHSKIPIIVDPPIIDYPLPKTTTEKKEREKEKPKSSDSPKQKTISETIVTVDDNEKIEDNIFTEIDGEIDVFPIDTVIVDNEPPTLCATCLDVPPFFLKYKKGNYEERFAHSKKDINNILSSNLKIPESLKYTSVNVTANVFSW